MREGIVSSGTVQTADDGYAVAMDPYWPDETEPTPRFGRSVRLLALILVIAMVLFTLVPVIVRLGRQTPAPPTTTQPSFLAVAAPVGWSFEPGTCNL